MTRLRRMLALLVLASPMASLGCGGSGPETPPAEAPPAAETSQAPAKPEAAPAEVATPQQRIDTKSVVDIVKEEAKGGEAKAPSPENILWLFPDEKLIQDETLEVEVPEGLQPLTPNFVVPLANPITKGKYELGRQLYFEPRISLDGTVSCATCHDPAKGWTDHLKTSVGIDGQVGGRNAPTVLNTAYGKSMFWDGRAPSLEGQAQGPPQNPIEMGNQTYEQIVERLRKIDGYREQFRKVFGTDVTLDGMVKAIATFERVAALSGNSAYDKYRAGDQKALDESQKRGMILFGLRLNPDDDFKAEGVVLQKGNCTACHAGFNFTDELFHNLGVGYDASTGKFADPGRWGVTPVGAKNLKDLGAFKTPTVRDSERTAPYMHDGSEKTLEDVVEYYNKGGNPNPYLDKDMKPLNLTDQEKKDLVAFLKATTGEIRVVELPTLPPGPDGTSPDPKSVLVPPKKKTAMNDPHGLLRR